ncbi:MAG: hypothetical protein J6C18_08110 [Bacteroidaceae bacterium]|nr:hypothetical protein [Bacteroidaceae bacterium]
MIRRKHFFANTTQMSARVWKSGILCLALCAMPLTGCDEWEDWFDDEDEPTEEPIENPYKEYDNSPEAMILKQTTKPTEGLYGTGESENPYLIRNASELRYFINAVSDGSLETAGNYFRLMNDITVHKNYMWYPIGTPQTFKAAVSPDECHTFYGSFDGNGHAIKGKLNLQYTTSYNYRTMSFGLFYKIGPAYKSHGDYSIKDLIIDADVDICGGSVSDSETLAGASTEVEIGILAAYCHGTLPTIIRNCHIYSDVKFMHDWRISNMRIGGFCAGALYSDFYDCSFNGSIDMNDYVAAGNIEIGGIVGSVQCAEVLFDGCINNADIMADNVTCVELNIGGICGDFGGSLNGGCRFQFTNCSNTGKISPNKISMQTGLNSVLVGGIVGCMWEGMYVEKSVFSDCHNSGYICLGEILRGDDTPDEVAQPFFCTGGIIGHTANGMAMENCINTGNITAGSTNFGPHATSCTGGIGGVLNCSYLSGCHSTGDITGTDFPDDLYEDVSTTELYVGGLAGVYLNEHAPIHNCHTGGNISTRIYGDSENTANCGYIGTLLGMCMFQITTPFIYSCSYSQASIDGKPCHETGFYIGNSKFIEEEVYWASCNEH